MAREPARSIYQGRIDILTDAIMSGDMERFAAGIALPYSVKTCDARVLYDTEDALKLGIGRYSDALRERGVTRMERQCESATYINDSVIEGYNTVRLLTGNELAVDPYMVRMRLKRGEDGMWRVSESTAAMNSEKWPLLPAGFLAIHASPDAPASEAEERVVIFQTFLNRINQVLLGGDLQGWRNATQLPLTFIHRQGTSVMATEEDREADFRLYHDEFRIHEVDDIVRRVDSATFISDDQMLGTYRTYILRGSELVVDPYDSSMTLQKGADGLWRITSVMNALGHLNWRTRH